MADPQMMQDPGAQEPPDQATQPAPDQGANQQFLQTPIGTAEDAIREQRQQDPTGSTAVTTDEQAEYEDLVARLILAISDPRKPNPETPSPAEATLALLNNPKLAVPDAIGTTAARVVFNTTNNAKRNQVVYDPDVLFHGADELIAALYLIGNAAQIFPNDPLIQFQGGAISEVQFDDRQMKILEQAKMKGVLEFGKMLEQTGQITEQQRKEARDFWKQQIEREIHSGTVSDKQFDQLNFQSLREQMAKLADHGYDSTQEGQAAQAEQDSNQSTPGQDEEQAPPDQGQDTGADQAQDQGVPQQ